MTGKSLQFQFKASFISLSVEMTVGVACVNSLVISFWLGLGWGWG